MCEDVSGMLRRVVWYECTNVSEELFSSTFLYPGGRFENNIKMYVKGIECEGVDWIM
jgi:hypothetical protein